MDVFEGKPTIVSHSATRHLVWDGTPGRTPCGSRVITQCGMNLKADVPDQKPRVPEPGDLAAGPFIPTHDCQWCVAQEKYAPAIRQLKMQSAMDNKPLLTVSEIIRETGATVEEICHAIGGAPDLYWAQSGVSVLSGQKQDRR